MKFQQFFVLLAMLLVTASAPAAEYVKLFQSDIIVKENGDLQVTETIIVHAEGKSIRRGIYRDFPTRYQDRRGRNVTVDFELISVQRDRNNEAFHTKNLSNGIRVYIGDSNVYLDPGYYTYTIRYRTSRQLGFFEKFDELYWNVTGNGWAFEIQRATARVTLPGTATNMTLTGFTGPQGSTEQDLDFQRQGANRAFFESLQPLAAKEGMTIVMGWPKGLVREPSPEQRRAWFFADHQPSITIALGSLALFVYYLLLWRWCGRDPEAGTIIPLYRAPGGYSPASMRFIEQMGYDKTCFTTAIINLAVKGAVEISDDDGDFMLRKTGPANQPLAAGEAEVLAGLFAGGEEHIEIKRSNHRSLSTAIERHKKSLKRDYEKQYFKTNSWLVVPGVVVSLVVIVIAVSQLPSEEAIMKTIFVVSFSLAPLSIAYRLLSRMVRMGKNGIVRYGIFLLPALIFFWFFFTSGFPFMELVREVPPVLAIGLVALVSMNYFFYQWLKAPTLAGRRLLDKIEGFKHYLQVAEDDEIAMQGAPQFSSEIYETYLPYAIALDLENEWTAKLDRAIAAGAVEQSYSHPRWYHSRHRSRSRFCSNLANSFNSAIASSSVAPGSSSGSSGGSSGGGGGGGGGGGW